MNDLRRIFRTPGSYNHKKKYAPNYPQVTFYAKRFDLRYSLQGLKSLLPAPVSQVATVALADGGCWWQVASKQSKVEPSAWWEVATKQQAASNSSQQAHTEQQSEQNAGDSVIAAYNAAHKLSAMLLEYGYTDAGSNRYMRPGGKDSPGVELFPTENNARIWSSNDPLYCDGHRATPFTVFCVYDHTAM